MATKCDTPSSLRCKYESCAVNSRKAKYLMNDIEGVSHQDPDFI